MSYFFTPDAGVVIALVTFCAGYIVGYLNTKDSISIDAMFKRAELELEIERLNYIIKTGDKVNKNVIEVGGQEIPIVERFVEIVDLEDDDYFVYDKKEDKKLTYKEAIIKLNSLSIALDNG